MLGGARGSGRHDRRSVLERRNVRRAGLVRRARRPVPQHVARGVGSVRRHREQVALRAQPVLAADADPPAEERGSIRGASRVRRPSSTTAPTLASSATSRSARCSRSRTTMLERGRPGGDRRRPERRSRSSIAEADRQAEGSFARLSQATGTKVVHISERDTQVSSRPKAMDEFVNTWSIEGFFEEGTAPAELGWGTHERRLPKTCSHADRRSRQPDLPRAAGHPHLRPLLGSRAAVRSSEWWCATPSRSRSAIT